MGPRFSHSLLAQLVVDSLFRVKLSFRHLVALSSFRYPSVLHMFSPPVYVWPSLLGSIFRAGIAWWSLDYHWLQLPMEFLH
jgi:hypothetical protein